MINVPTLWLCEMCEQGTWMYYGCDCGPPHRLCWECIERHQLIDAVPPDPRSRHLAICPNALRVARAVMGDPEMLTLEIEGTKYNATVTSETTLTVEPEFRKVCP